MVSLLTARCDRFKLGALAPPSLLMLSVLDVSHAAQTLSRDERQTPSLTPVTVHADLHLPSLDELRTSCFFLGSSGDVFQHICLRTSATQNVGKAQGMGDFGVCELSDEFSSHYGEPVVICKTRSR